MTLVYVIVYVVLFLSMAFIALVTIISTPCALSDWLVRMMESKRSADTPLQTGGDRSDSDKEHKGRTDG